MFLSETACQAAGITSGVYPIADLKDKDCSKIDISDPNKALAAIGDCCGAAHEAAHLADQQVCEMKNDAAKACVETSAAETNRACMKNAAEKICASGALSACITTCNAMIVNYWLEEFDSCMCDQSKEDANSCTPTLDEDDCNTCYQKCLDFPVLNFRQIVGPNCSAVLSSEPVYLPAQPGLTAGTTIEHMICDQTMDPAYGHSCSYYVPSYNPAPIAPPYDSPAPEMPGPDY